MREHVNKHAVTHLKEPSREFELVRAGHLVRFGILVSSPFGFFAGAGGCLVFIGHTWTLVCLLCVICV